MEDLTGDYLGLGRQFLDKMGQRTDITGTQDETVANQFVAEVLGEGGGGYDDPGSTPLL
jgi:hypothetical protein